MDKITLAALAAVLLAACNTVSTRVHPMHSAPGEKRLAIECPTAFPAQCQERAARECGGAFDELAWREGRGSRPTSLIVDCR